MFWPFSSSQSVFPMKLNHLTQGEMAEPNRAFVCIRRGFLGGPSGEEPTCQCRRHKRRRFDPWETRVWSLGWEDPQRRAWQPILAWRIPWTEEPGGLQSIWSQRIRHDWSNLACTHVYVDYRVGKIPWKRKWQPTPIFLPGKSHGQRSLAAYSLWGHKRVAHNLATKQ